VRVNRIERTGEGLGWEPRKKSSVKKAKIINKSRLTNLKIPLMLGRKKTDGVVISSDSAKEKKPKDRWKRDYGHF